MSSSGTHKGLVALEAILKVVFGFAQIFGKLLLKTIKPKQKMSIPPIKNLILHKKATELATLIRRREITSTEVIKHYINRIQEVNGILNFLVDERFALALEEAQKVDDELSTSKESEEELEARVPFLGVPFTVKESLGVKGLSHTVGVHTRKDIIATEDADVVTLIRNAGAIPIAVTNTPEICCWYETFNHLHGLTLNPYHTAHSAGGSSGGEAAALATACSIIGLGSDFAGSIRIPAAFNGVFGHKPSSNTVSIKGHYPVPDNPVLQELLVTGPLTRYATDLRPIMKLLTQDQTVREKLNKKIDVSQLKIFYLEEEHPGFLMTPVARAVVKEVEKTALHFKKLGAKVEKINLEKMKYSMLYWYSKVKTDDGPQVGKLLNNNKESISVSKELLKSIFGCSKHTLPVLLFGFLEANNGVKYNGRLHKAVSSHCEKLKEELKIMLQDDGVLLCPTHPTAARQHYDAIVRPFDLGLAAVFNVLGFPATHCPTGFDTKGLPMGTQVVANCGNDHLTIAVAEEIERAFGGWVPPYK